MTIRQTIATTARASLGGLCTLCLLAVAGCSAAYHDYQCGCVPYRYCPERPLPYGTHAACPTPIAARVLGEHAAVAAEPDAGPSAAEPTPAARQ